MTGKTDTYPQPDRSPADSALSPALQCKCLPARTPGLSYAPATLAKYASIGGGPRFLHDNGRIPLYPETALDEWARSRLSPLKSSTSDPGYGEEGQYSVPPAAPRPRKATPIESEG